MEQVLSIMAIFSAQNQSVILCMQILSHVMLHKAFCRRMAFLKKEIFVMHLFKCCCCVKGGSSYTAHCLAAYGGKSYYCHIQPGPCAMQLMKNTLFYIYKRARIHQKTIATGSRNIFQVLCASTM
jgi:hypothetical protein